MTMPMMDPSQMQQPTTPPPQPPVLPPLPNPFPDRPNDTEPQVALIYQKRLSKLFVDPKFMAMPPEWQSLPIAMYQKVTQALMPAPVLPHGVSIIDKIAGGNIGSEEQSAVQGIQPQQQGGAPQPGQPQQPAKPRPAHVKQMPTSAPGQRPL